MPNTSIFRHLLTGTCTLALATPAWAQNPPATEVKATTPGDLEVIIVTAQNRKENIQDVPIAIDVVSGEELRKAGFTTMNDIDKIAPAVQLNQDQGTVKITVRGVGTTSNDEAQDTSVVVNVDGEYINRPNALGAALFDMERVEVLRGPQGTLYGRNSTGGAINFITRKPGNDLAVDASASYGDYNAIHGEAGVDLPLGDTAALRVAAFYDDRDGYTDHPSAPGFFIFPSFNGGQSDDNEAYGGRMSLRLDPGDQLSFNLAGEYAERHFTPQTFAYTDLHAPGNAPTGPGCNADGYVQVAPAYPQTLCVPASTNFLSSVDRGKFTAPTYGLGNIDQETYAVRGRAAYEFSDAATLTYIGGYRNFKQTSYLPLPVIYQSYGFEGTSDTQSHELRLNGTIGRVFYQVGGFYFKETLYNELGFFVSPIGFPDFPAGSFLSYFGRDVSSDSKSAFGQAEFSMTDTLTAVGGVRYTKNKRSATYISGNPFVAFDPTGTFPVGSPNFALFGAGPGRKDVHAINAQILDLGSDEDQVTWLAGLNYKPNSDTLVYGKVSTGFKGGGFDAIGTYKPETNTAYEAGWKQTFGEHASTFNLSAFYYDYKDLQVSVLLDTTKGGQTFNAGKATIYGLEASADFQLTDNDTFRASANYLHARYDELLAQFNVYTVPGTGPDINGVGDLDPNTPEIEQPNFKGNTPPFSPEYVVTLDYDHVFDLGGVGNLTARANTMYKSSYFTDFFNYHDSEQEAFWQTDVSLEYKPQQGHWSVLAFAKNLEDNRPLTYGSFVSAGPDDIYNWQFGTPRTYGVRVDLNF